MLLKRTSLIILIALIIGGCGGGTGGTGTTGATGGTGGGSSATLSWDAPTTNIDGSALTDLAGYKIYYGTSPGNYSSAVDVGNVNTYTISGLSAGANYFAVSAYNTAGNESNKSDEVSKVVW